MLNEKQQSSLLYKHFMGMGSTRLQREFFEESAKSAFAVLPKDIWMYAEMIPNGSEVSGGLESLEKIRDLSAENPLFTWFKTESQPKYPIVKFWDKLRLTPVDDGTDNSFYVKDENGNFIRNAIPFNYYEDYYAYSLYTEDGRQIPFGVGDWTFDASSGILSFFDIIPDGIDHNHPPLFSFYQYAGECGIKSSLDDLFESAVLPITNFCIPEGSPFISLNKDNEKTLLEHIKDQTNKVEDNYLSTYGFDGGDKNEGVAFSWERVFPLIYTKTKDYVKGYDSSATAQIVVTYSSKYAVSEAENDFFSVGFVSHNCSDEKFTLKLSEGNIESWADGELIDSKAFNSQPDTANIKLALNNGFCYVQKKSSFTEDAEFEFSVANSIGEDGKVTGLLLYWSSAKMDYLPFVPKEEDHYDFGFPIVSLIGKIPPSMKMDSTALTSFEDQITPDYYGPRVAVAVIGLEDGDATKSADYIVKNKPGFYLDEILTAVREDHHYGKVYLRSGIYKTTGTLDLSDIIIEGEGDTKIEGDTLTISNGERDYNHTCISHIELDFKDISISNDNCIIANVFANSATITVEADVQKFILENATVDTLKIKASNPADFSLKVFSSRFRNVEIESANVVFADNVVTGSLTLPENFNSYIKSSYINKVFNFSTKAKVDGTFINEYDLESVAEHGITPIGSDKEDTTGRFAIFDKNDFKSTRYAEFKEPFHYNRDTDVIELLYDKDYVDLDADGRLYVTADTKHLHPAPDTVFSRGDNASDDNKEFLPAKQYNYKDHTIDDVLKDLWHEKADLTASGKIPLQQLPDAVAYGGLMYVGNWSFEDHDGEYPTFNDANQFLSADNTNKAIQRGWFWVVSASKNKDSDSEEENTPVAVQVAKDGVEYTAGDWVVYCGGEKQWDKLDRAFSDPAYSPLPSSSKATDEPDKPWYWKNDRRGGALELGGDTIITAFNKVNDQLRKLEPRKPDSINDSELVLDDKDIPKIKFRKMTSGDTPSEEVYEAYDGSYFDGEKSLHYTLKNKSPSDSNLIYFGDSAKVSVELNEQTILDDYNVGEAYNAGGIHISAPKDAFENEVMGKSFWNGISIDIDVPVRDYNKLEESDTSEFVPGVDNNSLKVSLTNVRIDGDDSEQMSSYNGNAFARFSSVIPYFYLNDSSLFNVRIANQDRINALMKRDICSGIEQTTLDKIEKLEFSGELTGIWSNILHESRLIDFKVMLNDKDVFCETVNGDTALSFKNTAQSGSHANYSADFDIDMPITFDKDIILTEDDELELYATFYSVKGTTEVKIASFKNVFRIDGVSEKERLTAGSFDEIHDINYGEAFNSNSPEDGASIKKGRMLENGKHIYEYSPGTACFYLGEFDNIAGFTVEIHIPEDKEVPAVDKFTGSTEGLRLQCRFETEHEDSGSGLTMRDAASPWLDCNSPVGWYNKPANDLDPVMYAAKSTALRKRVSFGRLLYSGKLYIRLKTEFEFTSVELVEVV